MLSQREDRRQVTRNRSVSPRMTPLTSDHVHVQHRNFYDNGVNEQSRITNEASGNDTAYARSSIARNDEAIQTSYGYARNDNSCVARQSSDFDSERNENRDSKFLMHNKSEFNCVHKKKTINGLNSQVKYESAHLRNVANDQKHPTSYHKEIGEKSDRHVSSVCEYASHAGPLSHEISRTYDYYSKNTNSFTEDKLQKRLGRNDGEFPDNFHRSYNKYMDE